MTLTFASSADDADASALADDAGAVSAAGVAACAAATTSALISPLFNCLDDLDLRTACPL